MKLKLYYCLFYFKKLNPKFSLGNVGENLKNKANVYFSRDAGLSWKKVNLQLMPLIEFQLVTIKSFICWKSVYHRWF